MVEDSLLLSGYLLVIFQEVVKLNVQVVKLLPHTLRVALQLTRIEGELTQVDRQQHVVATESELCSPDGLLVQLFGLFGVSYHMVEVKSKNEEGKPLVDFLEFSKLADLFETFILRALVIEI